MRLRGRFSSPSLSEISLALVDIHEAGWRAGIDVLFPRSAQDAGRGQRSSGGFCIRSG